jgi:octanoyl-[GcvH]:protein N-octanoyltransferase
MRVLRGRAATPEGDRQTTRELLDHTAGTGEHTVRVWTPHRQVAFGRRDTNREGYDRARQIVAVSDYALVERTVGGHAVAYTGRTIAFAATEPVEDSRTGIQQRYDEATATVQEALADLGAVVEPGEPDGSFCPGAHSLSAEGKVVGLAQRVRRDLAVTAGIVVVRDHEAIAAILEPIYRALDIPFQPDAVGSIARAGGSSDPEVVARTVETALVDGHDHSIEQVRET